MSQLSLALVLIIGSLLSWPSLAEQTLQERIPNSIKKLDHSFLTFTAENDLFGGGTDEHYTSGVRLTYFNDKANVPKLIKNLGQSVPFFNVNETTSIYYSLGQNLYTPEDITTPNLITNDRPYAGFLYGSVAYETLSDNHIDGIELTLGIIGPAALGEQTQKFVHQHVNSPDPKGWEHQLENEAGLMVAYQRQWPEALAFNLKPLLLRVSPHAGVTVGNIYTYANSGLTLQLVPQKYQWQTLPTRVRPAIPGSGYFVTPSNKMSWSLFAGAEARAIGRNIFLDGNSFEDSHSVDKKYAVYDFNTGFTINYGKTRLAYTLNWRSDEFYGQQDNSLFGSVSLGFRF